MTVSELIEQLTRNVLNDDTIEPDTTDIAIYLEGTISGIVEIDRVEFTDESGVLYPLIITKRIGEAK